MAHTETAASARKKNLLATQVHESECTFQPKINDESKKILEEKEGRTHVAGGDANTSLNQTLESAASTSRGGSKGSNKD